jgi:hypothetical protein
MGNASGLRVQKIWSASTEKLPHKKKLFVANPS